MASKDTKDRVTMFDVDGYQQISKVREEWLYTVLGDIPFRNSLESALDIGCGAGYFSNVLSNSGFRVTGIDLRPENIEICNLRYPDIDFSVIDLDSSFDSLGSFDLVLMFGILYHLQSPLQTILRLSQVIGQVGLIETRVASGDAMACYLFEELKGDAHNLAGITAVPTLPAIIQLFYYAGIKYIYRPIYQPIHEQFQQVKNGQRHCFVVSRQPITRPDWQPLRQKSFLKKWEPLLVSSYI